MAPRPSCGRWSSNRSRVWRSTDAVPAETTVELARAGTYLQVMLRVLLLLSLVALLTVAPGAAAKTVSIRAGDGTSGPTFGRAGATWKPWKVRGVQVGVRLSKISVSGFTSQWTEQHTLSARIGLRCRYPTVKSPVTPGYHGPFARVAVTAGVAISTTVPGMASRCLAPSRYLGVYFIGLALKPDFNPAYVARFAGTGTVPSG